MQKDITNKINNSLSVFMMFEDLKLPINKTLKEDYFSFIEKINIFNENSFISNKKTLIDEIVNKIDSEIDVNHAISNVNSINRKRQLSKSTQLYLMLKSEVVLLLEYDADFNKIIRKVYFNDNKEIMEVLFSENAYKKIYKDNDQSIYFEVLNELEESLFQTEIQNDIKNKVLFREDKFYMISYESNDKKSLSVFFIDEGLKVVLNNNEYMFSFVINNDDSVDINHVKIDKLHQFF